MSSQKPFVDYSRPENIIDLKRYPIQDLTTPVAKALVLRCQDELRRTGACVLEGFVTPEATELMAVECQELAPQAFHNELTGNAYLSEIDESLPEDHARRIIDRTALGAVAYDQIPLETKLRTI